MRKTQLFFISILIILLFQVPLAFGSSCLSPKSHFKEDIDVSSGVLNPVASKELMKDPIFFEKIYLIERQSNIPSSFKYPRKKLEMMLEDPDLLFFILMDKGEPLGYVVFSQKLKNLNRIAVVRDFRGDNRQGYGTHLLSNVIEFLIANMGLNRLNIMSTSYAAPFYETFSETSDLVLSTTIHLGKMFVYEINSAA